MDVDKLAKSCLPEKAKIRLCRGNGLYIVRIEPTDAENTVKNLTNNGFLATLDGDILTVSLGSVIIETAASDMPRTRTDDHLYRKLCLLAGRGVCRGETELFVLSLKARLFDAGVIENRLRRQAAICMREGCGGLLHAVRYEAIKDKGAIK